MNRLHGLLKKLAHLIDEGDSDAINLAGEIKKLLERSDIIVDILKLESQIKGYNFEKAQATLLKISKVLGLEM